MPDRLPSHAPKPTDFKPVATEATLKRMLRQKEVDISGSAQLLRDSAQVIEEIGRGTRDQTQRNIT